MLARIPPRCSAAATHAPDHSLVQVNDATHVSVVSEPGVALLSERLDVVKRLTETQSKQVFRQMVDALQSLHATSATHGLVRLESAWRG